MWPRHIEQSFVDSTRVDGAPALLVFLDPHSPNISAFIAVLNALAGIAEAPSILAVVRIAEDSLDAFRAGHRVRFNTRGLTAEALRETSTGPVVSILHHDDGTVERRTGSLPPSVVSLVRRQRDAARALTSRQWPAEALSPLAGSSPARNLAARIVAHEARLSALPDGGRRFFETSTFSWIANIEKEWRTVRAELDSVLKAVEHLPDFQTIQQDQAVLTQDHRWKVFLFQSFGSRLDGNRARCPETTRLIETIPGLTTAMFSILRGRKHLPPHRGPFKGVLRFHLALKVPGPCRIRVGDEFATWQEGQGLVFDDTFEHEVWNESDHDRVVLFVDFLRPLAGELEQENLAIVDAIGQSPYILNAKDNADAWEEQFGKVVDELRGEATAARPQRYQ